MQGETWSKCVMVLSSLSSEASWSVEAAALPPVETILGLHCEILWPSSRFTPIFLGFQTHTWTPGWQGYKE